MVGLKRKELAGRRFTRIVSVGGGAKNLAWLQIKLIFSMQRSIV